MKIDNKDTILWFYRKFTFKWRTYIHCAQAQVRVNQYVRLMAVSEFSGIKTTIGTVTHRRHGHRHCKRAFHLFRRVCIYAIFVVVAIFSDGVFILFFCLHILYFYVSI